MIKCIIFDKDGVLVNTEPLHFRVWQIVTREAGVDLDYDHYKGCIGSTSGYLFDLIEKGYGVSLHQHPTIRKRFREVEDNIIQTEGLPEIDLVPETIQKLYDKGYTLAVASSSPQYSIEATVQQLGIAHCFRLLFSAERVKHPKPAPDVFLETAHQLGFQPDECVVIEDSRNGSLAAKAAGMTCFGFINPDSGDQDLSAADRTFSDYSELLSLFA